MIKREQTLLVKNKTLSFGHSSKVLIQSMCDVKTSNVKEVIKQINECQKAGADLMRLSILDEADCEAIKIIKQYTNLPLVADIHYNYVFALKAIEYGIDKIRINPGNIKDPYQLKIIILNAKKNDVIVRIGLNSGSIQTGKNEADSLVKEALKYIQIFEECKYKKVVVSLKSSNPLVTYEAYKKFAEVSKYPLHIGVTESGYDEIGIIRSVSALSPLLINGIGNTIRISLTHDPLKEIETCKRLLHDLGLYDNYPTIISCPTCGRCLVNNTKEIAMKTLDYCKKTGKNIKVAVMGCAVNGIGEGKSADIGIAGAFNEYVLFKEGKVIGRVKEKNALKALFAEIDKF